MDDQEYCNCNEPGNKSSAQLQITVLAVFIAVLTSLALLYELANK